jgi:hypothetical protein
MNVCSAYKNLSVGPGMPAPYRIYYAIFSRFSLLISDFLLLASDFRLLFFFCKIPPFRLHLRLKQRKIHG